MKTIVFLATVLASSMSWAAKGQLDKVMGEQMQTQKKGAVSQKKISKTADETRQLSDDYRLVLRKIENTKLYNKQLQTLIASQESEAVSTKKQIEGLKNTNKMITPLMVRMVDTFEKFVSLDVPFLPEERSTRVKQLKATMGRADVSVSEKYRRILEAYQVENEYGRTIEAYRGVHKYNGNGNDLTVDFLRVGRLTLMFQSLDGEVAGLWNQKEHKWMELASKYKDSMKKALKIARKQMAPDLIELPVSAPEVVQ